MSKKRIMLVGAVIVLLLGAGAAYYYFASGMSADDLTASDGTNLPPDKIGPDDKVMGSPNAPVTVIEYFAQACSVCAHFDQDVFPLLKAKYIDTGKVRYAMRLFPLFPVDPPSYKLDLCLPPDHFFQAADILFRNQPQWDSGEYPVPDAHAGLIRMARIMGLSSDQADACMNSTVLDAAINKRAQDGVARYQINETPTFIIDFKKVDMPEKSWEEAQAALDAALAAKGAK